MSAPCIVVLNRKGGTGKTSTAFHTSHALAKRGRRVLLVDLDPQSNLSEGFLGAQVEALPPERTVAALYSDAFVPDPRALIVPTPVEGVDLLPGSEAMEDYSDPRPAGHRSQGVLREFVAEVRGDYGAILLDCPPALALASWSAMVAADAVLTPVVPEDFGAAGIRKINRALALVRAEANPGLRLLGYLVSQFNPKLAVHAAYVEQLRAAYGDLVMATTIPLAADFKLAVTAGKPVGLLKPRSAAAKAIDALAAELLERAAAGYDADRKEVA
jgi:chromosome partitioning protein